jgi:macrolide transport system ATP-binding/permease protein
MSFWRKLSWAARRRSKEDELAEELRFHLEEEAEGREEDGLTADQARWAARRELGNLALVQETTRAAWGWTVGEQLAQDVRYGARNLRRNPAFTLMAALSLALGIGANTAIYSYMDALLMRKLPVPDPESLVVLKWHLSGQKNHRDSVVHDVSGFFYNDPKEGHSTAIFPYRAFELLGKSTDVLSVLFGYHPTAPLNFLAHGQAEMVSGEYVSGDYFRGLKIPPAAGRLVAPDDDRAGATAVIVLSYAFAQRRFGDAARAAGQAVLINNLPFTAIGVTPPGFFGIDPSKAPEVFLPFHADMRLRPQSDPNANPEQRFLDEHNYWVEMMGRLRPGVSRAQAKAALGGKFDTWVASTATKESERQVLPKLHLDAGASGLDNLRRQYSQPIYILLAMVGLILAIACANIANLLLARATARRREIAVRLSMGAGRWRVIRQLLTESLMLASVGGVAGILVATWGVQTLKVLLSASGEPFPLSVALNWHVLGAATALTMLTGLLFGLAPALRATQIDVMPVLKEARTGEGRRGPFGLGPALVVLQIAFSLLLLLGAGLFVRTLSIMRSLEMGFQRENLLTFSIDARQAGHHDPEILSFYRNLEERFRSIPGVIGATVTNSPLIGSGAFGWPVFPVGKKEPEDAPSGHGSGMSETSTRVLATRPGFFSMMHTPLAMGREFDARDRLGSAPVVIVNQAWVKVNLDGVNPIGQHVVSIGPGMKPIELEIVGVAKNARYDRVTGEFPAIVYMAYEQNLGVPPREMTYLLRTAGDPLRHAAAVRQIVREADSRIPVTNLITQAAKIDQEMSDQIVFAHLCTVFALLALTIACVGLYGTMSYTVERRTGEIGIRMALGAQRDAVVWMVLRDALWLAVAGLAISVPAAIGASTLIESYLYGVKSNDAISLAGAAGVLMSAALIASFVPARRASRIDPMTSLRHE